MQYTYKNCMINLQADLNTIQRIMTDFVDGYLIKDEVLVNVVDLSNMRELELEISNKSGCILNYYLIDNNADRVMVYKRGIGMNQLYLADETGFVITMVNTLLAWNYDLGTDKYNRALKHAISKTKRFNPLGFNSDDLITY